MSSDSRERRLLMVLESCYPTVGGGGAENQVRTISRYLHRRSVPVRVITPMNRESLQVEHDDVDDVPVWRIPYPKVRWLGALVLYVRLAAWLIRHRRDYDVVHVHIANNMAAVCAPIGRLLGKTVIVKLTGALELRDGVLAPGRHPLLALKRAGMRCANFMQATSTHLRARLLTRGFEPDRVLAIPNAVEIQRFAKAAANRTGRTRGDTPLTGIYVGRLESEKGVSELLDAWMETFSPHDDVRLNLVGEGRLRAELESRIAAAGRERQVRFLGAKPDVDVYLAEAHFGVLPSMFEGLSNTLLEYMAAGLPVLGTRVSGTEDFIEHGRCGWLVEPGDTEAMVECLKEIESLDREVLVGMGEAACERVTARASIDAIMARLAELYEIEAALAEAVAEGQGTCAE